jgi:uncharacterized membrane protein (UPF0182 family)
VIILGYCLSRQVIFGGSSLVDLNWAAMAPLILVAVAFIVYCWFDIVRNDVRYLPKWVWGLICVLSVPLGGIVYLLVGRER